jgi:hypothetical protein
MNTNKLTRFVIKCVSSSISPSADISSLENDLNLFFSLFSTYSKNELEYQLSIADDIRKNLKSQYRKVISDRQRYLEISTPPTVQNPFEFMYDNTSSAFSDRRTYDTKYSTSLAFDFINILIPYNKDETDNFDKIQNTLWNVMCFIRVTKLAMLNISDTNEENTSAPAAGIKHKNRRRTRSSMKKKRRKTKKTRKNKNRTK